MGGKRIARPGWFMQPTILTDIAPGNPAFRDEFFGPVASFFRVKTEDDAIALANDSDFGLAGSVWTQDEARGLRVASRVDTGMMFVNNIPVSTRNCLSVASSTRATAESLAAWASRSSSTRSSFAAAPSPRRPEREKETR
jgi:hypothetical protein